MSYSLAAGGASATDTTQVAATVTGGAETPVSATGSATVATGVKAQSVDAVPMAPTDKVTLQGKAQVAVKVVSKPGTGSTGPMMGSVVFVYNAKGHLRIRYMDSKNNLVYQTPPVMLARTEDLMLRSTSSVSARV